MQSDCKNINDFLHKLGFGKFDENLVKTALTHSSYTNEHDGRYTDCYERLEFLGDAVLKLITSDYLYKTFPDADEGKLTKIRSVVVSDEVLAKIAADIKIAPFIILSDAEASDGGRSKQSILACVMEALFGAIYLSGGIKEIEAFVIPKMLPLIDDLNNNRSVYNAKALLQEYIQANAKVVPEYRTVKETGKANAKTFFVEVLHDGQVLAQGVGKTKRAAQQHAAFEACKKLKIINEE